MATVSRHVAATPERVYAILSDGWTYAGWVVGASTVRAVDPGWPRPGARLHHAVGAWPLVVVDYTEAVATVPNRSLRLRARGWPLGEALVTFDLTTGSGGGTDVTMQERGVSGPALLTRNPVGERLIALRNAESLTRLARLAEARERQTNMGGTDDVGRASSPGPAG